MSEENENGKIPESEGPPGRATWFKFYGQRYLMGGSLRAECPPDERSVWSDFLCLANGGGGQFDIANRDALAVQLMIPANCWIGRQRNSSTPNGYP